MRDGCQGFGPSRTMTSKQASIIFGLPACSIIFSEGVMNNGMLRMKLKKLMMFKHRNLSHQQIVARHA